MLMSQVISFKIVLGGGLKVLVTEAERVIEAQGRVIYAGQDDLSSYRKSTLFWGQKATRLLLDLPYEIHLSGWCEVCVCV